MVRGLVVDLFFVDLHRPGVRLGLIRMVSRRLSMINLLLPPVALVALAAVIVALCVCRLRECQYRNGEDHQEHEPPT